MWIILIFCLTNIFCLNAQKYHVCSKTYSNNDIFDVDIKNSIIRQKLKKNNEDISRYSCVLDIVKDSTTKKEYFFVQHYSRMGYSIPAYVDKTYQSYYDEFDLCQTYLISKDSNHQEKSLLPENTSSLSASWGHKQDETGICLITHLFTDTGGLDEKKMSSDDFIKLLRHSPHYYLFKYDWEGKKLWQTKILMLYGEESFSEDRNFLWVVGEKKALKNRQKIFVEKIDRRTGKIVFSKLIEDISISPPREEYYHYKRGKSQFRAVFSDQKGGVYLAFGGKNTIYEYFIHINVRHKQTKIIQQYSPQGYAIILKKFPKNAPIPPNMQPQIWRGQAERAGGSLQMVEVAGQICYFAGTWALEKDRDEAFEMLKIEFPKAEKVKVEDWKPVFGK